MERLTLREWRRRRLLTQVELAERAGVTQDTITRMERGAGQPHISTLRKIITALDIAPEQLVLPDTPIPARPRRSERTIEEGESEGRRAA